MMIIVAIETVMDIMTVTMVTGTGKIEIIVIGNVIGKTVTGVIAVKRSAIYNLHFTKKDSIQESFFNIYCANIHLLFLI